MATVLASLAESASPMLLKLGIDGLQAGKQAGWLWGFAGLMLLIAALGGVFRFQMRDVVIGLSRWIESDIRQKFFTHLLRLPPIFFDHHHTGDLMARATEDVERLRMVHGPALLYIASTQLTLIFSAVMMFYVDFKLALILLLLAPLVGLTMLYVARTLHKVSLKQQEVYGQLTTVVQENVAGIRVIKSYTREDYESNRFGDVSRKYFKRSLAVARTQAMLTSVITLQIGVGSAAILYIGGTQVIWGEISLGDFIAFMGYLSLMTWPMLAMGWVVHLYQRGAASNKRLNQIFDVPIQFENDGQAGSSLMKDFTWTKHESAPGIEFRNLTFRYRDEGPDVLKNISVRIPAGGTLAVVGQTGSGKSSLGRLLARLYHPTSGDILIDEVNLGDIPVEHYRKSVAYVDQTPFLFSTSIEENIRLGQPDATDNEVEAAAYGASFDKDIAEFPDSYKTIIGERGVTLSGGQQQRLTIARALLMNSPILILDDALSAVDAHTEAEIIARLRTRIEGRTTMLITHRLAAAEMADLVAVLDQGELVEYGTPTELLSKGGLYFEMYQRQRLAHEIEEA
jgi:ATP-binding cassette subfamily B protein